MGAEQGNLQTLLILREDGTPAESCIRSLASRQQPNFWDLQERLSLLEKMEQRPLKLRPKDEQEWVIRNLSPSDMEMLVDLRPFMQRNPHVVQADDICLAASHGPTGYSGPWACGTSSLGPLNLRCCSLQEFLRVLLVSHGDDWTGFAPPGMLYATHNPHPTCG